MTPRTARRLRILGSASRLREWWDLQHPRPPWPRDSPVVGYVTHHSPDPARRTNAYILVLEDLTGSFKPVRYICQEWAPI